MCIWTHHHWDVERSPNPSKFHHSYFQKIPPLPEANTVVFLSPFDLVLTYPTTSFNGNHTSSFSSGSICLMLYFGDPSMLMCLSVVLFLFFFPMLSSVLFWKYPTICVSVHLSVRTESFLFLAILSEAVVNILLWILCTFKFLFLFENRSVQWLLLRACGCNFLRCCQAVV